MQETASNNTSPRPQAPATEFQCRERVAELLLANEVISEEELTRGRRILGKMGSDATVLSVLKQMGVVNDDQICATLKKHRFELPLGNLLVELGHITPAQLRVALKIQEQGGDAESLGDILIRKRVVKEQNLARLMATQFGLDYAEPDISKCEERWLKQMSAEACVKLGFFPVRREADGIMVAFADPTNEEAQVAASKVLGATVIPVVGTRTAIKAAAAAIERSRRSRKERPVAVAVDSPTGLVDALLQSAIAESASDIHIEPLKDHVRVRFRIDGVLRAQSEFASETLPGVVTRLKVLAKADISEKRRHQDGRILYEDPRTGAVCDMRASFYVTVHGEAIVLRILNQANSVLDLEQLGMSRAMIERFKYQALDVPSGVIIVTGPTGSGKTTTLYSCVNYLNDDCTSIITAEDPVEYLVDGISQCSLNAKLGLTFEDSLRHIVRQDPDVIVLGEIRDAFSAESAIQAALTGHKVLTTFHTEDSIGGLLRLLNMNIEAFLISSTVVCVVAQRLIRRICADCSAPQDPDPRDLQLCGWSREDVCDADFRAGRGCETCHFTGYKGRIAVFENLVLTEAVRDAILARKTSAQIRRISVESSGLVTLLEDGLAKAARGDTTLTEVRRALPRLCKPRPLQEIRRLAGSH